MSIDIPPRHVMVRTILNKQEVTPEVLMENMGATTDDLFAIPKAFQN